VSTVTTGRSGLLFAIGVVLLSLLCHASSWNGWWTFDDPQLLLHALRVPASATLFNPVEYQKLATHTFTPLLPFSLKIDLILGKLNPHFFYVHQWVSLTLAALLLFALLRRYASTLSAFFGAAIFLASWPAVYAARALMIRHYVEGLVLALIALVAFSQRDVQRGKTPEADGRITDVAAAFFYLLAMLGKELYVPLILLFAVQSRVNGDPLQRTVRRLTAPAVALLTFTIWRTGMLESLGGYEHAFIPGDLLRLPWTVMRQLGGPAWSWTAFVLAAALVAALVLAIRAHRNSALLVIAAGVIVLFIPLLGLASAFEWRFTFAFAPLIAAAIAIGFDRLGRIRESALLLSLLVALLAAASFVQADAYARMNARHIVEGKHVYEGEARSRLMLASSPSWYLAGLSDLRNAEGRGMGPQFTSSLLPATANGLDPAAMMSFNERSRRFEPLTLLRGEVVAVRSKRVSNVPYKIEVSEVSDVLQWNFRCDRKAEWIFVTLPSLSEIAVPPTGSRRIPEASEQQYFRVKLTFPDGTWSLTPELPMPDDGETTTWRNGGMK
jgi:hypothetical protein